jgi:antitoxin component of MazEF toxin-antitoxin module
MVKVYKQNNKLVIYVPFEVIEALGLKTNDEVDFFKFNDTSFLFAKKSDVTNLIVGGVAKKESARTYSSPELSAEEINVLKKLDTLRYQMRNKERVEGLLNSNEKGVLQQLIKKRAVVPFKDQKSKTELYSISKSVYDRFLMRKKQPEAQVIAQPVRLGSRDAQNENVRILESKGFIVLQSEAEASSLSLALEESIRQGLVLGTRSFSKKFYILLRSFFDKHSSRILKALRDGESRIGEISSEVGVEEDGARAILYLLAESGDVSEKRRDVFELA